MDRKPTQYRVSFLDILARLRCPVEGCRGTVSSQTNLRVNFSYQHPWGIIVILEEGNQPHPRLPQCYLFVPQDAHPLRWVWGQGSPFTQIFYPRSGCIAPRCACELGCNWQPGILYWTCEQRSVKMVWVLECLGGLWLCRVMHTRNRTVRTWCCTCRVLKRKSIWQMVCEQHCMKPRIHFRKKGGQPPESGL